MKRSDYDRLVEKFTGRLLELSLDGATYIEWRNYKKSFMRNNESLSDTRKQDLHAVYMGIWRANQNRNGVLCYVVEDVDGLDDGMYSTRKDRDDKYKHTLPSGKVLKTTEYLHDLRLSQDAWNRLDRVTVNAISEVAM